MLLEPALADLGGQGRGRTYKITFPDLSAPRLLDLVVRQFTVDVPNQLRVAGLTYLRTWSGFVNAALVIDTYSRMILLLAGMENSWHEWPLHQEEQFAPSHQAQSARLSP